MGRTVSYSVVKRNNPLDQDAVPKFYAQAQANGHVEIREMADRIQKTCTVTRADVMAVLVALEDVIMEALEGGEIVRLADLGTFQIGLSGRGAETEDAYDVVYPRPLRHVYPLGPLRHSCARRVGALHGRDSGGGLHPVFQRV